MMFLGAGVLGWFGIDTALLAVIIFQGAITIFTLVTLPVEFDASNRALIWLKQSNITSEQNHSMAQDAQMGCWHLYGSCFGIINPISVLCYALFRNRD